MQKSGLHAETLFLNRERYVEISCDHGNIHNNTEAFQLWMSPVQIVGKPTPGVLVIVTIDAEVFPVGAIRRIISGVAVFMVDSQKMPVFRFKLPSAFGTDEPVYFKRLFPVITWGSRDLF